MTIYINNILSDILILYYMINMIIYIYIILYYKIICILYDKYDYIYSYYIIL